MEHTRTIFEEPGFVGESMDTVAIDTHVPNEEQIELLGEIGEKMIFWIMDHVDDTDFAHRAKCELYTMATKNTLRKPQSEMIQRMIDDFLADQEAITGLFEKLGKEYIIDQITRYINSTGSLQRKIEIDPNKITIRIFPAAISVEIGQAYYSELFSDFNAAGFSIRPKSPNREIEDERFLLGRFFVINTDRPDVDETRRHEYMHILTNNYIVPHELDYQKQMLAEVKEEIAEVEKKKVRTRDSILELEEELNYVDYSDVMGLTNEIQRLKRELILLEKERENILDKSSYYRSEEMYNFFLHIRDELVAHAVEGQWVSEPSSLLGVSKDWNDELDHIPNKKDVEKFKVQWQQVGDIISKLKIQGISARKAVSIFLTSQNLDHMYRRLSTVSMNFSKY